MQTSYLGRQSFSIIELLGDGEVHSVSDIRDYVGPTKRGNMLSGPYIAVLMAKLRMILKRKAGEEYTIRSTTIGEQDEVAYQLVKQSGVTLTDMPMEFYMRNLDK